MLIMLNRGVVRVYWIGLPVMPTQSETSRVKRLNRLFKAAAARHPQVAYIDGFGLLATDDGDYIASLRSGDGVHFTSKGAQRLADAVWAAMRRDWNAPR
jgi:hypothetical protein